MLRWYTYTPRSFAFVARGAKRLMGDAGINIALSDKLGIFFLFILY